MRMHVDEIETSPDLVHRLLSDQFPQWAALPVALVDSYGTDHDIYRLGESLSVRLPRIGSATGQAEREADLARFVRSLRAVDTLGAPERPRGNRGGPLCNLDDRVRAAVSELGDRVDTTASLRVWEEAADAPGWDEDVWVHDDLLPGNLIVSDGRLCAVIDRGCLTVGDPATDLLPAWNVFSGSNRTHFRAAVGADDATWARGRGWALSQALIALPYYWDTNPGMVRQALIARRELGVVS